MSDHEVNLKILLGGLVDKGALKLGARNTLIRRLTKEIASQVLANNDLHALQVSLDRVRSLRDTIPFGRAIEWVAEEGGATALVMGLPSRDQLARRMESRSGLSRPELAVLSAHVKMHLQKRLESQDPARVPGMDSMRLAYFPKAIRRDYPQEIADHMLADQVGWTVALTQMVADTGATFVPSLLDLTSREPVEIMGAWYHVRDHIKLDSIRTQIEGCTAPVEARYKAWVNVTDSVLGLLAVSLAPGGDGVDPEHLAATAEVLGRLGRHRGRSDRARIAAISEGLVAKGMASGIADKVAGLGELSIASEIAAIRPMHEDSLRDSVVRYLAIGNASRLLGAIRMLEVRRASGHWDQVATGILRTRFFGLLRALVERTPLEGGLKLGVDRASFRLGRGALKGVGEMVDHIVGESPDVGALLVAEERLRGAVLRGPR
jgi:glutamate dehydrogenase